MKNNTIWTITTIFAVIGIVLASYLLFNTLTANSFDLCSINATINCKAITTGSISSLFGIPVALIGLIGYIAILIASRIKNRALLLGMSAFGMIFCLRLTVLELFFIKVICPVCLACQTIMFILFIIGIYLFLKKSKPESSNTVNSPLSA